MGLLYLFFLSDTSRQWCSGEQHFGHDLAHLDVDVVDNIKVGLQKVEWGTRTDWVIDLAEDRDRWRGCCECGNELSGSIKCLEFLNQMRNC